MRKQGLGTRIEEEEEEVPATVTRNGQVAAVVALRDEVIEKASEVDNS